jgi:hypothetical protein
VKRLALFVLAAAALGGGIAHPAAARNECNGLPVCVPVAGPWVVVPVGKAVPRPRVDFQLTCPKGYIVGGLDADVSNRAVDLTFAGTMGAPVNPGITTSRSAVFSAVFAGSGVAAPSFRPHVGCMPASGGGGIPTLAAYYPPGKPTVHRVKELTLFPQQRVRVVAACASGERLLSATHAIGFWTEQPPVASLAHRITAVPSIRDGRASVEVRTGRLGSARAMVQVLALCGGGQ